MITAQKASQMGGSSRSVAIGGCEEIGAQYCQSVFRRVHLSRDMRPAPGLTTICCQARTFERDELWPLFPAAVSSTRTTVLQHRRRDISEATASDGHTHPSRDRRARPP